MILSILIPSLISRKKTSDEIRNELQKQIIRNLADDKVEVLMLVDNGEIRTGEKRNKLIEMASGKYIVFVDDDDMVSDNYIELMLKAADKDPDVIPINGYMTTNGSNHTPWEMGLGMGYHAEHRNGQLTYIRFPNHIAAMKREKIKDFQFLPINRGEDYEWAKRINDAKVLQTEERITEQVYHYKYIEK